MAINMDPVDIRQRIKRRDFPKVRLKLPVKCSCDNLSFIRGQASHSSHGCAHEYLCTNCGRGYEVFQFYCKNLARERDIELDNESGDE